MSTSRKSLRAAGLHDFALGIKRKRLKAALSPDYLALVLAGQGLS